MSRFKSQYFDARPPNISIGQANAKWIADFENTDGIRYSSPWPWFLALSLSLAVWATIGWLIWGR